MVAKGMWFLLRDENVLKFVVIATLICEYTKKHRIIYFKWASCMACELFIAVFFKVSRSYHTPFHISFYAY